MGERGRDPGECVQLKEALEEQEWNDQCFD